MEAPIIYNYGRLVPGKLLKRYKRFLADIVFESQASPVVAVKSCLPAAVQVSTTTLSASTAAAPPLSTNSVLDAASLGSTTVVHCPNTGPMTGLLDRLPSAAWCSVSSNQSRKYAHTLELLQVSPGGALVGVHSALANKMALQLLQQHLLPDLGLYDSIQPEVRYGAGQQSRVDFVLTRPTGKLLYLEVKSVTLADILEAQHLGEGQQQQQQQQRVGQAGAEAAGAAAKGPPPQQIALFPDTVSERAQRHVQDLMSVVQQGHEAACLFIVQRPDCSMFAPCHDKDSCYSQLLVKAAAAGVQVLAAVCAADIEAQSGEVVVRFTGTLPLALGYKQQQQQCEARVATAGPTQAVRKRKKTVRGASAARLRASQH